MSFQFVSPLYAIVDTLGNPGRSCVQLGAQALAGGARLIQLRLKDRQTAEFVEIARALALLAATYNVPLIVNDRADIAKVVGAAGVHLGQNDLPAQAARQILGPDAIIGVSTHTISQAHAAAGSDAVDYIGFGPIYATSTKENPDPIVGLDGLREVRRHVRLPIVAIGGITQANMQEVRGAGADAVAMISEIVRAVDVQSKVSQLLAALRAS